MSVLRIRFDPAFDGPVWPGPLRAHGTDALFGTVWSGELGLLDILETALGLGGLRLSKVERAAALVDRLRALDGFWSASAGADPLGTALRLIEQRDQLWLHGWRGQPVSKRLSQLAQATAEVPPALPDRLAAVSEALAPAKPVRRSLALEVESLEPVSELMPAWSELLERVAARGGRVAHRPLQSAASSGDLAAARSAGFRPVGDGSLRLARAQGPLAAAEDVAAWIAALPARQQLVIVGGDAVLDAALDRFALPTTGGGRADPSLLQVVPLALELGWQPPDPALAHQLLVLARGPIARRVARPLLRALQQWPAVDSDDWRAALVEGLEALDTDELRQRQRQWVTTLFCGVVPRGGLYPSEEIERRLALIDSWAERCASADPPLRVDLGRVRQQCRIVRNVIGAIGNAGLSAPDLRRVLTAVHEAVDSSPVFDPRAGVGRVTRPDSVAGPARYCVWWGFDRDSAPRPRELGLSARERAALRDAGLDLPDPGNEAIRIARRWRRPLEQTTEALLLVCPQRSADGEECFPHPLWDEIEARTAAQPVDPARTLLQGTAPPAITTIARRRVERLPLAEPRPLFRVAPGRIGRRDCESPGGLAKLLGCPARWVMEYFGRLRPGLGRAPDSISGLSCGKLTHRIFADLLALDRPLSPTEAAREAERLFDSEGPRLVAPLFLPGSEQECGTVRQTIASGARELFAQLAASGAAVRSSEVRYERAALGTRFAGIPDLVLEGPDGVVDFKWGSRRGHQRDLERGTALQLAAYAMLAAADGASLPPVAYLVVRDHALLTTSASVFPDGIEVARAPAAAVTWRAAGAAHDERRVELDRGDVVAPGAEGHAVADHALDGGVLRLAPPCVYCELGLLCGRALAGER